MPDGGRRNWTLPRSLMPAPTVQSPQSLTAPRTDPGLGKINQFVTLVSKGGVPVTLCNAFGNPYPTTGYGALVFNHGAEVFDLTVDGSRFTGDVQFPDILNQTGDLVSFDQSINSLVGIHQGVPGQVLTAGAGTGGQLGWTFQGTGTVTNISTAAGSGIVLTPSPITTTGSITVDTAVIATRTYVDGKVTAQGLPAGGTTGQYLVKSSNVDFAAGWQTLDLSPYALLSGATYTGTTNVPNTVGSGTDLRAVNVSSLSAQLNLTLPNYAPLNSPLFTGDPRGPTPSPGDNDTSLATTAFVQSTITALNLGTTYA